MYFIVRAHLLLSTTARLGCEKKKIGNYEVKPRQKKKGTNSFVVWRQSQILLPWPFGDP
jgi:hypothetical protein